MSPILKREAVWVIAGQVLTAIGGLVCIKLMTKQLRPETYGEFTLILTICLLITQVLLGGVNAAANRFFSVAAESLQIRPFFIALFRSCLRILGAGGLIAFCGVAIVGLQSGVPNSLPLVLAFLYAVTSGISSIINSVLNSARERKIASIHQAGDVWLRVALLAILLSIFSDNLPAVLLAYTTSTMVIAVSQGWFTYTLTERSIVSNHPDREWQREIFQFARPYIPWTLVIWLQQSSDRWALEHFSDTHAVGAYAVVFQLGYSSLFMLFTIGIRFIQPIVYEMSKLEGGQVQGRQADSYNHRLMGVGAVIGMIFFIISWLLHPYLFAVLVGAEYRQYSHYLPWMVLSAALFGMSEVLALKMQNYMRVRRLSIVKITLGFAGVGFNFIGAALSGLAGVVAAFVAFNIVNLMVMAIASREK
jgi:O-antigen/teichoic acid export membrane protein